MSNLPIAERSVKMIQKLAESRGQTFMEAGQSDVGRYILRLTERVTEANATASIERPDASAVPTYLQKAAEEIAVRDGISVATAYGRIRRQRPALAKRYYLAETP